MNAEPFDVIVVGGGHAGCEAAAAAARRGARVALICFDPTAIGAMSCNPAIGGLGKGHLVREIDALDGILARAADRGAIHYRMLNASKGRAVQGPRIQADRKRFGAAVRSLIEAQVGISVLAGEVTAIVGNPITGVELADGSAIAARSVVLCTGTFLRGRLFRGAEDTEGGRVGDPASNRLADQLRDLGIATGRLKTGTPPRLDGRTIDWAKLAEQPSDTGSWTMSAVERRVLPQIACAITRTNVRTHDIVRAGLAASPLRSGAIQGRGPRYCPSIEDKVDRFGDRDGHQIFLEPEGLDTPLVYPNGISTSLPADMQDALIHSIEGLDRAKIVTPGYAVEYGHIDPRILDRHLALSVCPGLFLAGQVNGTTGYEEAASQGLVAGANAAAWALSLPYLKLERSESYIAVMIDDLVLHGVTEPYRMLTARAEFRLSLRADNAATRLGTKGRMTGLIGAERAAWQERRDGQRREAEAIFATRISAKALALSASAGSPVRSLAEWCRFETVDAGTIRTAAPDLDRFDPEVVDELYEDCRYAPYLVRQQVMARDLTADHAIPIPPDFPYGSLSGLSNEMVERLTAAKPDSLGAAARIRGITPAALALLFSHLKRRAA